MEDNTIMVRVLAPALLSDEEVRYTAREKAIEIAAERGYTSVTELQLVEVGPAEVPGIGSLDGHPGTRLRVFTCEATNEDAPGRDAQAPNERPPSYLNA